MLEMAINIAFAAIGIAMMLCLWRLVTGPDLPDRILALDTLYINAVALLILLGIRSSSTIFFEAALLIALMGFVGTVALARYLARGDVID
jgi:multicomponent K+:H+ antiporter subunit F